MNDHTYTAEDFAYARFAEHRHGSKAVRWGENYRIPWHTATGDRFSDEQMAEQGWTPVVESRITEHTLRDAQEKAARKRQKLLDHIADQYRVIRRRNDEIAALRRELRGAQAPLSLDGLTAAWEATEQADECRKGDVLMTRHSDDNFEVWVSPAAVDIGERSRILSRAAKAEGWADLADVLGDFAIHDTDGEEYPDVLGRRGVRVTVRVVDYDERAVRTLSRAPKRAPWQDLADILLEDGLAFEEDIEGIVKRLHERGVRVTGGDET